MNVSWGLLLAVAIAIRLAFVFLLPFGQKIEHHLEGLNDEPAHFNYVKYCAVHRALPVQTETVKNRGAFERNVFEYYQPPLYYVCGSLFYAAFGERYSFFCCRLFSFLCGILTVMLIGHVAAMITRERALAAGVLLFAALLPTPAYFSALVSNDALSWLFAALITCELVKAGDPRTLALLPWRRVVSLSCCLTAGMLTKSSLAVFYPLIIGYFAWGGFRKRGRALLGQGCIVVASSLLLAAPWYLRNLHLYGSLFAINMGFGAAAGHLSGVSSFASLARRTVHYFWFPMQHVVSGSMGTKMCNLAGGLLVAVHGGAALWYLLRQKERAFGTAMLASLLVLACFAYINLNSAYSEPEGRFLLPAFAAIAFFFVAPAYTLLGRFGNKLPALAEITAVAMFPYLFLLFARSA